MVLNLTKLNTITPYAPSFTNFTNKEEIITNSIAMTNNSTHGYYWLIFTIVLYLFILMVVMALEEPYKLDFVSANVLCSGLMLLLSLAALLGGVLNNFDYVQFYGVVLTVFAIARYVQKVNSV